MKPLALCFAVLLMAGLLRADSTSSPPQPTTMPSSARDLSSDFKLLVAPIEAADGDNPLRQKLKERHNTAARLLQLRLDSYRRGVDDITEVFDAAKLVVQARGDLAQDTKEHETLLEQLLAASKSIETRLEQQWKRGIISEIDVLRARFARESLEAELLKLKAAGAEPSTQPR